MLDPPGIISLESHSKGVELFHITQCMCCANIQFNVDSSMAVRRRCKNGKFELADGCVASVQETKVWNLLQAVFLSVKRTVILPQP